VFGSDLSGVTSFGVCGAGELILDGRSCDSGEDVLFRSGCGTEEAAGVAEAGVRLAVESARLAFRPDSVVAAVSAFFVELESLEVVLGTGSEGAESMTGFVSI